MDENGITQFLYVFKRAIILLYMSKNKVYLLLLLFVSIIPQSLSAALEKSTLRVCGDYEYDDQIDVGKCKVYFNSQNGVLRRQMFEDDKGHPMKDAVFIIQKDFKLQEDIIIPENSVLKFEGGYISGQYSIIGRNTTVEAGLVKIFDPNIKFDGDWSIKEVYPEWFGAKGNDSIDDTESFQKAINFAIKVDAPLYLCNTDYYISSTLYIDKSINMKASSRYSFGKSNIVLTNNEDDITLFKPGVSGWIVHSVFEGITFTRLRTVKESAAIPGAKGPGKKGTCFGMINEVTLKDCGFIGFKSVLGSGCTICYVNNCSAYCINNFLEVTQPLSSLFIFNSNFFAINKVINNEAGYGMQQLVFDNCWIEEFYKFYSGAIRHLQGISVTNSTLTNTSYSGEREEQDYFIDFTDKDPHNRYITFNFINSTIYSKYELINPVIAGYKIGKSWIYHYYDFDFYDCKVYCDKDIPSNVRVSGNSWWFNTSNHLLKPSQTNYGINTRESILYNNTLFKEKATFEKGIALPNYPEGSVWFDVKLNKPIWQSGTKWVESDGAKAGVARCGSYRRRPTANDIYVGFQYFNTDTHKTITWADGKWWNPDGTEATH